jgi:2-succinyl-6-hydroxy-2,4-cyclohexadiene-1-carboxylate synthase
MINWNAKTIGNPNHPSIIFLHGFLGSREDWLPVSRKLGPPYQFLLIDLPGHVKTAVTRRTDYIISNTAKYLVDFLVDRGIQKCHLVGYSMGGRLALYLATKYPEIFDKVILESVNPGLSSKREKMRRIEQDEKLAREIENLPVDVFLKKWYDLPLFQSLKKHPNFSELFDRRCKFRNKSWPESLRGMGLGRQPALWRKLAHLKMPILILAGEKDEKFRKIAFQMKQENSGFDISVVRECGHNVHFENQKQFLIEVENFLKT